MYLKTKLLKSLFLLFFLLSTIFFSCTNKSKSAKKTDFKSLTKSEMVKILVDIHIAEAAAGYRDLKGYDRGVYSCYYYNSVFKKYNLSKDEFQKNIDYYAINTSELDLIYKDVITELSKKQSKSLAK